VKGSGQRLKYEHMGEMKGRVVKQGVAYVEGG
jgi:hypothetical protein